MWVFLPLLQAQILVRWASAFDTFSDLERLRAPSRAERRVDSARPILSSYATAAYSSR